MNKYEAAIATLRTESLRLSEVIRDLRWHEVRETSEAQKELLNIQINAEMQIQRQIIAAMEKLDGGGK